MANNTTGQGFRPLRHILGGTPGRQGGARRTIAAAYATSIFNGDAVKSDGNGGIVRAAAGNALLGIFKGIEYTQPTGDWGSAKMYTASLPVKTGKNIYASVYEDPGMTFLAVCKDAVTAANIGAFVDLDDTQAGDTNTQMSRQMVTTAGSPSQFQILAIHEIPQLDSAGNQALSSTGAYAIVELKIVKHELLGAAAGIAV